MHEGAVLGRECAVVRPTSPELTSEWTYIWTQSSLFRDQVSRHSFRDDFAETELQSSAILQDSSPTVRGSAQSRRDAAGIGRLHVACR